MSDFAQMLRFYRRFLQDHTREEFRDFWADLRQIAQSEGVSPLSYIHECRDHDSHVCVTSTRHTRNHASHLINRYLTCRSCSECVRCHPTCDTCEECRDRCECYTCSGCDRTYSPDNTDICQHCENCSQRCCECRICTRCDAECSENGCNEGECDRCGDCCECSSGSANVEFFSHEDPTFHTCKRNEHKYNPTSRYISAEIEVAECNTSGYKVSEVVRKWRGGIVEDGSLPESGFEINTAPASGDMYVKQIQEITSALESAQGKVNQKCGLHVHIDARDLNYYDIRRLIHLYAHIERTLFQMVPESRQTSGYCDPCGSKYTRSVQNGKLPYKKVKESIATSVYGTSNTRHEKNSKYNGARYAALNLHSWFFRGTVECRMFNGTLNAHKITQWGILWATIIDYAQKHTDAEVDALYEMTSADALYHICGSNNTLKAFVTERRVKFRHIPQQLTMAVA